MPGRKNDKDSKRSARYHSVINLLSAERHFQKSEIYQKLKDENPSFVGRIIGDLLRDGYPAVNWSLPKPNSPAARAAPMNPPPHLLSAFWLEKRVKMVWSESPRALNDRFILREIFKDV